MVALEALTEVFRLADSYVDELCALDPFTATGLGIPGHDDEVTDYSPDGVEARVDLDRRTLRRARRARRSRMTPIASPRR